VVLATGYWLPATAYCRSDYPDARAGLREVAGVVVNAHGRRPGAAFAPGAVQREDAHRALPVAECLRLRVRRVHDEEVARRGRLIRSHGMETRYVHDVFGMNLRMAEIQAAIGRVQLGRLSAGNAQRGKNAAYYDDALRGIDGLIVPEQVPGHVWHQYTVRIPGRRDAVLKYLHDHGSGAEVYYPIPVHRQPAFDEGLQLPVSERLATEVLSLPVFPGLTTVERETVAEELKRAMMEA